MKKSEKYQSKIKLIKQTKEKIFEKTLKDHLNNFCAQISALCTMKKST